MFRPQWFITAKVALGTSSSTDRAYLYRGRADALPPTSLAINAPDFNGLFGFAVAGLGDVDADGRRNVAVGAPAVASSAGAAYVFPGSATSLLGATPSRTYSGSRTEALDYYVR